MANSSATANATTSATILLSKIKCNSTSERGHDELYLHYSIDGGKAKRFPEDGYHSIEAGESWTTNLAIQYKTSLVIELYDSDTAGDDFLGSCSYSANDATQDEQNTASNTNGANYTLYTGPDDEV